MTPAPDFPPFTCPNLTGLWYAYPPITETHVPSMLIGVAVGIIVLCALVAIATLYWLLFRD